MARARRDPLAKEAVADQNRGMSHTPIIAVPADLITDEQHAHRVYDKYLDVILSLGALPVIIPAVGLKADLKPLLQRLDGILLPGSRSNVAPALYGRAQEMDEPVDNHARDATTLPLIRAAVETGVPVFAICRGIQELNVALGGTLHQQLDRMPDRQVHQFTDCDIEQVFAPSHEVSVTLGSKLYEWLGEHRIMVNSAHNQAIDDVAPSLVVEAKADDGTVEAVRVEGSPGFAYGVQWHPEFRFEESRASQALFGAFGAAVKERANHH